MGNRIAGVPDTHFSWKSIAANTVTNLITAGIGNSMGITPENINGVLTTGDIGKDLANGLIGGVVSLHVRRSFGFDDPVNYGMIAADAFGNALGNAAVTGSDGSQLQDQSMAGSVTSGQLTSMSGNTGKSSSGGGTSDADFFDTPTPRPTSGLESGNEWHWSNVFNRWTQIPANSPMAILSPVVSSRDEQFDRDHMQAWDSTHGHLPEGTDTQAGLNAYRSYENAVYNRWLDQSSRAITSQGHLTRNAGYAPGGDDAWNATGMKIVRTVMPNLMTTMDEGLSTNGGNGFDVATAGVKFIANTVIGGINLGLSASPFGFAARQAGYSYQLPTFEYTPEEHLTAGFLEVGTLVGGALAAESSAARAGGAAERYTRVSTAADVEAEVANSADAGWTFGRSNDGMYAACFLSGTPVHTGNGVKPIEHVSAGDRVLSRNQYSKDTQWRVVLQTFATPGRSAVHVEVAYGDGTVDTISCTAEHPFFVAQKGWCGAQCLELGDELELLDGGKAQVRGVVADNATHTVYNFEVDTDHTYFVGERGVWVHNASRIGDLRTAASELRNAPGIAAASQDLVPLSGRWLDPAIPTPVPLQAGDSLLGQRFNSFNDLRSAIWRQIGNTHALSAGFSRANLAQLRAGRSPFTPSQFWADSGAFGQRFNIHHVDPIYNGGLVYDLSNLRFVSPRTHFDIHYGPYLQVKK